MAKGKSKTSRTIDHIKSELGGIAGLVERTVTIKGGFSHGGFTNRFDLFGFIDIVALIPDKHGRYRTVGIQDKTSLSNAHAGVRKITTECRDAALTWIAAGNEIEVWAWRLLCKRNAEGKRLKTKAYVPEIIKVLETDFD